MILFKIWKPCKQTPKSQLLFAPSGNKWLSFHFSFFLFFFLLCRLLFRFQLPCGIFILLLFFSLRFSFFHSVCRRDNFSPLLLFYILLCTLCVLLPAMGSVSGYSREGKYECFLFCFYLISEWNGQQVPVLFSFRIVLFFFLVFLRILL